MREPMLNLPPATGALAAAIVVVHILRAFLDDHTNLWIDLVFGVVPLRYALPFEWPALVAPLTYALLHGSWLHLGINAVTLAAFGAGVERMLGPARMLVIFVATSLAAALIHVLVYAEDTIPVIGASGGISGLFAGAVLLLHRRGQMSGSLRVLVVVWLAVAVVTGVIGMPGTEDVSIAWVAHIGGFLAGLLVTPLLIPRRSA
jgi:membrane associated rhomboid family serine protease